MNQRWGTTIRQVSLAVHRETKPSVVTTSSGLLVETQAVLNQRRADAAALLARFDRENVERPHRLGRLLGVKALVEQRPPSVAHAASPRPSLENALHCSQCTGEASGLTHRAAPSASPLAHPDYLDEPIRQSKAPELSRRDEHTPRLRAWCRQNSSSSAGSPSPSSIAATLSRAAPAREVCPTASAVRLPNSIRCASLG